MTYTEFLRIMNDDTAAGGQPLQNTREMDELIGKLRTQSKKGIQGYKRFWLDWPSACKVEKHAE
jgi:hypothetical protein